MRAFEIDKFLIGFLRGNLIILLPLTILLIQLIVRWMAREEPKEVFRSVLTIPLDIVYIAISFVLSGLARLMPRFSQRYTSDRDTDLAGAVLIVALTGVAVLLTLLGRGARLLWQKFYAALQQVRRKVSESDFDWKNPGIYVAGRIFWMLGYWVALVGILAVQLFLAISSLWYVLHLVE